jgi:beta-1,4-N-acetylglucosaminyltransferase
VIFVTVGTVFPFDRLITAVDALAGNGWTGEAFFAQVGVGGARPRYMEWTETLAWQGFAERMAEAHAVIAHAGMGTIVSALEAGKPLLVMPRRRQFGEHVNEHQVATARRFEESGHILVAWDEGQVEAKARALMTFVPKPRRPRADQVVARVKGFLESVAAQRGER